MEQNKFAKIGKSLIENKSLTKFTDLPQYLPKKGIAMVLGVHYETLEARMANLGLFTLENLFDLADSMEVDHSAVLDLAVSQYTIERKKRGKKKKTGSNKSKGKS